MARVDGYPEHRVIERERVFDGLVLKAARGSLRAFATELSRSHALVAAGAPSLSPEPNSEQFAVTLGEAGVVAASWDGYVQGELLPFLADTFLDAANGTGTALDVPVLDKQSGPLRQFLASALERLRNVGYLIWDTLRTHVFGVTGESPRQLAARVRQVAALVEGRALNTARTQVAAAANAGSLAQMLFAGFTDADVEKEWLATDDERTRLAHHLADGQRVPLTKPFEVGGEYLQFPGDPLGSPENTFNCRCALAYVIGDDVDALTAAATKSKKFPASIAGDINDELHKLGHAHWNPDLHPRSGKSGEFIPKGTSELKGVAEKAKVAGKKITPTKAIYKTKYADGHVVAESPGLPNLRLVATGNGFIVQSMLADGWKDGAGGKIGKGDAYQLLKNPSLNWYEPGSVKLGGAAASKAKHAADTATDDLSKALIQHEQSLKDDLSKVDDSNVAFIIDTLTVENYAKLSTPEKEALFKKAAEIDKKNGGYPGSVTSKLETLMVQHTYLSAPEYAPDSTATSDVTVSTQEAKDLKAIKESSLDMLSVTISNMDAATYQKLSPNVQIALHDKAAEVDAEFGTTGEKNSAISKLDQLAHAEIETTADTWKPSYVGEIHPDSPAAKIQLQKQLAEIGGMSPANFSVWFGENMDSKKWNSLAVPDQLKVQAVATFAAQSSIYSMPYDAIEAWVMGDPFFGKNGDANFTGNPAEYDWKSAAEHVKNGSMTWEHMESALLAISPAEWNDIPKTKKMNIVSAVSKADPSYSAGSKYIDHLGTTVGMGDPVEVDEGVLATDAGPKHEYVHSNFFDSMNEQQVGDWFDDLTTENWATYDESEKATILNEAGYQEKVLGNPTPHSIIAQLTTGGAAQASVPAKPAVELPKPATLSHGEKLHAELQDEMIPVYDLGHPDPLQKTFVDINDAAAKKMQQEMLDDAGKIGFSAPQVYAVQQYTTKHYQAVNAVLRNDQSRMKLFTDAQLTQAKNNAVAMQSAMLPTTRNVRLYRGVGAQAFGFSGNTVSFEELKKLEGKQFVDKAFVSTTTEATHNAGFQYGKKQIKVVIDAPKGTPGLHVSTATPGWQAEKEFILAAGSEFKIASVEKATADDKKLYGAHVEYVVKMRVTPDVGAPTTHELVHGKKPKPVKTTASPGVSLAATKTVNAPKPDSVKKVPFKFNTASVFKAKYGHDQVVAEKADGSKRVIWHGKISKFIVQEKTADGKWTPFAGYSKKDTYAKFKSDGDWVASVTPTYVAGDVVNFNGVALAPAPTVSGVPPLKAVDVNLENLKKQTGETTGFTAAQKKALFDDFKSSGAKLAWEPDLVLFQAAIAQHSAHEKHGSQTGPVTLLQAIRIIDAESAAKAGKPNTGAYEKKIVDWLQTPQGQKQAKEIVEKAYGTGAPGVPPPSTIGKPSTTDSVFHTLSNQQALEQNDKHWTATAAQRAAINDYTSSGYTSINGTLRFASKAQNPYYSDKALAHAKELQSAMYPSPVAVKLFRGTDDMGGVLTSSSSEASVKALVGSVVQDKGFTSTSITKSSSFDGKKYRLVIHAPAGTPLNYVKQYSTHKNENEMLLAAGTKYKIVSVEHEPGSYYYDIVLRVVP